MSEMIN